jgi:hypothetical protein
VKLSHTRAAVSAVFDEPNLVSAAGLVPVVFDEPNLVSAAGLVPVVALAESAGLADLAEEHLRVPTDKGAHPGRKVMALVTGMAAGADSIDDLALLRHGGMGRLFDRPYAPSTLGSFLRTFRFGHVRQLDAVAARFLTGLVAQASVLPGSSGRVLVDVDDTIIEVHGYAKQGAGFGYSKVRGVERAAGHGDHRGHRAAGRGVSAAEGLDRLSAGRRSAGRRRARHAPPAAWSPGAVDGAGAGRLGVLRLSDCDRRGPRRRRGVGHRPAGRPGQGRDCRH